MNVHVKRYSLAQLKRIFDRRILAVPEIQREFVWDARKVCTLLDSVYRGYPIGSALIWRTNRRNRTQLRQKLHILPPYDENNREIWFIVDGQQRLSVLYHVLSGHPSQVENARGRPIAFDRFFFYAGAADDDARETFIYRQGAAPEGYVPLVDVLGDRRRRGSVAGVRARRRMDECRATVLNAGFVLQTMSADRLEDVRETFIRINAQGTPVSSADKAFARASHLDVRHLVREAKLGLTGPGFDGLPDETILSVLAFMFDDSGVAGRAWERVIRRIENGNIDRREFDKRWQSIKTALPYAVDYICNHFGVAQFALLPSTQMVALLTLYFAHRGAKRPPRRAANLLRQWFWLAAVSDRYSGRGYGTNLAADARFMRQLAERGQARLDATGLVPLRHLRHAEYSARSSLSRGFFCLLGLHNPRYLEDGELVPARAYASVANRPDRHHIFPRHHLLRLGIASAEFNALPNVCLLVARENQSIGAKAPRKYMAEIPHTARARRRALRSHLIPDGPSSGLWDNNARRGFESFMEERAKTIADAFEAQAGRELFRRR